MGQKPRISTKSKDRITFEQYLKTNKLYPTPAQKKKMFLDFKSKAAVRRIISDVELVKKLSEYDIRIIGSIIKKNDTPEAALKIHDMFFQLTNVDIAKILGVGERRIYEIYQIEETRCRILKRKQEEIISSNQKPIQKLDSVQNSPNLPDKSGFSKIESHVEPSKPEWDQSNLDRGIEKLWDDVIKSLLIQKMYKLTWN